MAPFGPKLGQNDAPDLRIILDRFLYPKTMKLALIGVQVAPFGLKLCQNDAPDLRIILEALLGPKTLFKNQKKTQITEIPSFTVKN